MEPTTNGVSIIRLFRGHGLSLELLDCRCSGEHLHLAYGYRVETLEAITLRQLHVYEFGVHVFNIGQHQQLFDGGVVP